MGTLIVNPYLNKQIVTDGLVLYLDAANPTSYPGSGTTWVDLSPEENDATLLSGVGFSSENGGTLTFTNNADRVEVATPFSYTDPFTVLIWVKPSSALPDSLLPNDRRTLLKPKLTSNWPCGFWLHANTLRVHCPFEYRNHDVSLVEDTGWHLVGQVFDGGNTYGILDGEILAGTAFSYSPSTAATTLFIGVEVSSTDNTNWAGNIAHVLMYNTNLNQSQLNQNFNALRSRYGL